MNSEPGTVIINMTKKNYLNFMRDYPEKRQVLVHYDGYGGTVPVSNPVKEIGETGDDETISICVDLQDSLWIPRLYVDGRVVKHFTQEQLMCGFPLWKEELTNPSERLAIKSELYFLTLIPPKLADHFEQLARREVAVYLVEDMYTFTRVPDADYIRVFGTEEQHKTYAREQDIWSDIREHPVLENVMALKFTPS